MYVKRSPPPRIDTNRGYFAATLTFTIYHILSNPEATRKLREEVDEALGDRPIQLGDLNKFPYLNGEIGLDSVRCKTCLIILVCSVSA